MTSHVVVTGDAELLERLGGMRWRARNNEPALEAFGDLLEASSMAAFATDGASLGVPGTPWKPLSPPYLAWKIKHGFLPGILRKTGQMQADLVRPMAIDEVGPLSATWGTDRPYAKYHQSRRPRTKIPYRPFLVITPVLAQSLDRLVARWVTHGEVL